MSLEDHQHRAKIQSSKFIQKIENKKYKLLSKIGEGAYGTIYNAIDLLRNEKLAIKVMEIKTKTQKKIIERELFILSSLRNEKNIIQLKDHYHFYLKFSTFKKQRYQVIVMEKMDFDLMDYILEMGKISEKKAKFLFYQICLSVQVCHSNNIAHLDIKPDNILLKFVSTKKKTVKSTKSDRSYFDNQDKDYIDRSTNSDVFCRQNKKVISRSDHHVVNNNDINSQTDKKEGDGDAMNNNNDHHNHHNHNHHHHKYEDDDIHRSKKKKINVNHRTEEKKSPKSKLPDFQTNSSHFDIKIDNFIENSSLNVNDHHNNNTSSSSLISKTSSDEKKKEKPELENNVHNLRCNFRPNLDTFVGRPINDHPKRIDDNDGDGADNDDDDDKYESPVEDDVEDDENEVIVNDEDENEDLSKYKTAIKFQSLTKSQIPDLDEIDISDRSDRDDEISKIDDGNNDKKEFKDNENIILIRNNNNNNLDDVGHQPNHHHHHHQKKKLRNVEITKKEKKKVRMNLEVKLCDFGFVHFWKKERIPRFVGTKEYLPPEIRFYSSPFLSSTFRGDKADIWSLGVLLFCMITGLFPFMYDNKHIYAVNFDIVLQNTHGHTCLDLLDQMFHPNPDDRPTIEQVLEHPWLCDYRDLSHSFSREKPSHNNNNIFTHRGMSKPKIQSKFKKLISSITSQL